MEMDKEDIILPDDELEKVDKALVKYQLLYKTNKNPTEKKQIERKINELKAYRGKLLYLFELKKRNQEEVLDKEGRNKYLDRILETTTRQNFTGDTEINTLCIYIHYFYREFLSIFSERQMKLDFKFSLERDNFHHRYQDLFRRLEDYLEEVGRIKEGGYSKEMEVDLRRRNFQKKRNILIEWNKFFLRLEKFTLDILNDLNGSELICLNGDDIIRFELIEEKRFLEGRPLREGIRKLYKFVNEVINFINLPDIE